MQKVGEMCIATFKDNFHQAKLTNQGTSGIWVGYTEGHPTGTYGISTQKLKKYLDSECDFPIKVLLWIYQGWKTWGGDYELWGVGQEGGTWNGSISNW